MSDDGKRTKHIVFNGSGELKSPDNHKSDVHIEGRTTFATWNNISLSKDGIEWKSPSSFVIYTDGLWSLSAKALANFYNNYGYLDRHFSVRWWFHVDYYNAAGNIVYSNDYEADREGYDSAGLDVVRPRPGEDPIDHGFQQRSDIIVSAKGGPAYTSYYD